MLSDFNENLKYNISNCQQYLTLLDEGEESFTFQTFDDLKSRKNPELTKVLHGSIEEHFDELVRLNNQGAGIFVTVNKTDLTGRKSENIVAVRCVFQEADRPDVPIPDLEATITVETSPGKCHRYWVTEPCDEALAEFKPVMQTLVDKFGSDPNARDICRVLRLPGFYHMKDTAQPHLVKITSQSMAAPYSWDLIKEAIPPRVISSNTQVRSLAKFDSIENPLKIKSALNSISPSCKYQQWLSIGMALHDATSGSDNGYKLWDDWSSSGVHYKAHETAYKWESFDSSCSKPVTLATLFKIAHDNGWLWNKDSQLIQFQEAVKTVETAVLQYTDDQSIELKPPILEALQIIKNLDEVMYDKLRAEIGKVDSRVRLSTIDKVTQKNCFTDSNKDSLAEQLVKLTCERCELWHDSDGNGYASFTENVNEFDHLEHWKIYSSSFKEWLSKQTHLLLGKALTGESITTVCNTLSGIAKFDSPEYECFRRIGKDTNGYWIDLVDDLWRAIRITTNGWQIIDQPTVKFIRNKHMRPLPIPKFEGLIDPIWNLVNIPIEDRELVLAWILEAYRLDTPYPVLELTGEQGSAKSSTQYVLKMLIDPYHLMLRSIPKNVEDVYIAAKNNHLISLENLSKITNDISDALCTVSTGGGTAARTLITNDEETIIDAHNPIVINGIAAVILRQDLLDRTICLNLPTISERFTELEMEKSINQQLPDIFAGLLTLFSQTLANIPNIKIEHTELPRMADFAVLGEAMSMALGNDQGQWLNLYNQNRRDAIRRTIDSSPVAAACRDLIEIETSYKGTIQGLFKKLDMFKTDANKSDNWPRSARGLGDILRRIAPAFRTLGYILSIDNKPRRDGIHCVLEKST